MGYSGEYTTQLYRGYIKLLLWIEEILHLQKCIKHCKSYQLVQVFFHQQYYNDPFQTTKIQWNGPVVFFRAKTEEFNVKLLGVVYHDEQKWAKKKPFSMPVGSMYGILILHLLQQSTNHVG